MHAITETQGEHSVMTEAEMGGIRLRAEGLSRTDGRQQELENRQARTLSEILSGSTTLLTL